MTTPKKWAKEYVAKGNTFFEDADPKPKKILTTPKFNTLNSLNIKEETKLFILAALIELRVYIFLETETDLPKFKEQNLSKGRQGKIESLERALKIYPPTDIEKERYESEIKRLKEFDNYKVDTRHSMVELFFKSTLLLRDKYPESLTQEALDLFLKMMNAPMIKRAGRPGNFFLKTLVFIILSLLEKEKLKLGESQRLIVEIINESGYFPEIKFKDVENILYR